MLPPLLYGQQTITNENSLKTVRGIVTDEKGEVLPGVSITVRGMNKGTVTDAEGGFEINGLSANDVLVFSYVSFIDQTIKVGKQTSLNVILVEKINIMDDVIVVGYGVQKRQSITGAISSVNQDDLGRVHAATTSAMLSGKVPGLSFRQSDGRPGSGATIQVRNFGGDPLFVIDGIPQDKGAFDQMAPNDIESISVLKDASAAIYGLRAANGVVLVTTKKGQENTKPRVDLNMYTGWQNWTRFPKGVNAYDWQLAKVEGQVNQGQTPIPAEELEKWRLGTEPGYQNFDWYDYIVNKNAPQSSINANISGGGTGVKYYTSISHLDQDAAFKDYNYRRTNILANVETKIGSRLRIGVNLSGRVDSKRNPAVSGTDPDDYWQPRNALLNLLPTERPYANDNPKYPSHTQVVEANWALIDYERSGYYKYDLRVAQANTFAEYNSYYVPGLTAKVTWSYQVADNVIDNFEYAYDVYTYDKDNDLYNRTGGNSSAKREKTQKKVYNNVLQFQLNYDRRFLEKHHVGITLVNERSEYRTVQNYMRSSPNNNYINLMQFNDLQALTDSDTPQARVGYVVRTVYDFADKYYFEFSGRYDASWKYIPSKRWNFFPSFSAGWRMTEEPFIKKFINTNTITDIKLRGSYGVLGDDSPGGNYDYIAGYNNNSSVSILDGKTVIGIRDRGQPVTNVSWTKNHFTNIGLDYTLFKGQIYGSVDYFYRKRTGLLASRYDVLIPSEVGYSLPNENLNSDAHYGGEFSINYQNRINDFSYNIGFNFSYARRKMLETYKPRFAHSLDHYKNSQEDRYTWINWGYETDGVFQTQEEINNWPVNIDGKGNTTLLPGDFIIRDVNGDGMIDTKDQRPMAYQDNESQAPQPIVNGGITLGLNWKGIDFAADFSYAGGYAFTPNWETKWPFQNGRTLVKATQFDNRWRLSDPYDRNSEWIPGDVPPLRFTAREYSSWLLKHDYWTTNVKTFRLRSMEIGYSLPKKWINKLGIQKTRFYVNTYNLFSFDNVKKYGIDPEIADRNGLQYPQNRVINIGVNISY